MCIKICITTHITICITMYITHLLTPSFSALCAATPTCTALAGHIYSLSPPHAPYKLPIQHKTPITAPSLSPYAPLFSPIPTFPPYAVNTAAIQSPPSPAHTPSPPAIPIPPVNMWITP